MGLTFSYLLFYSLIVVFNDVLDHNFNFLVLLNFRSSFSITCVRTTLLILDVAVFVTDAFFVGPQNFYQVEVVCSASVPVHDYKSIVQPHLQDSIEELHVGLFIQIVPSPLVLME